jgi:Tol biopolymer transport system component
MVSSRSSEESGSLRRAAMLAALAMPLAAPLPAQTIELVSASAGGGFANAECGSIYGRLGLTPNGRLACFDALASDLVADDTNGGADVFVRDLKKGATVRASLGLDGESDGGGGQNAQISANGRFVVFQSVAQDLVEGDGNGQSDIFVRDLKKGMTTRVSVDSEGVEANGSSYNPGVSANGRWVVFQSAAFNLVPDDGNGVDDVFVHDRKKGTTTRVSVSPSGGDASLASIGASISANGRRVSFESASDDLVADDGNGLLDVFVRDLKKGVTERVSVDLQGGDGDAVSYASVLSGTGRFVAFTSVASDLVEGDVGGHADVFVRDLALDVTERVSVDGAGAGGTGGSGLPSLSPNGRFVAFESGAQNLVEGDGNGVSDIYLFDRKLRTQQRATAIPGDEPDGESLDPVVSASGRFVIFESLANNLVAGDPGNRDIFVRDMKH